MGMSDDTLTETARTDRVASLFLFGQLAMVVFATIALTTFLAGVPPAWLQTPANQIALQLGWRFSGPLSVILGTCAALAHAGGRVGARKTALIFVLAYSVSLASELIGTGTGYPFGPYSYTSLLGYLIDGRVPFPIPLSWFFMVYCSLAILGRVLPSRAGWKTMLLWSIAGGFVLTCWDVSMDPAMTAATQHWVWHVKGPFYGMPYSNWFGWWLTGSIVAWVMLLVVRPREFAARVSPDWLPLALYAINGIMPIALCLRNSLWWAAIWGTVAMAVPLIIALTAGARRRPAAPAVQRAEPRRGESIAMAGD
jgi:putative membrane protein